MSESESIGRVELRIVPREDPATFRAYANFVQLNYTPHDFTLHFAWFGIPVQTGEAPQGVVQADAPILAQVTIPLNVVRPLIELLERQAATWERGFGPLPGSAPESAEPEGAEERADEVPR